MGGLFGSDEEAAEYASKVDMSKVCKDYYSSVGITGVRGGDMKYLDLNEDGELSFGQGTLEDHGDRVVIGKASLVSSTDSMADLIIVALTSPCSFRESGIRTGIRALTICISGDHTAGLMCLL